MAMTGELEFYAAGSGLPSTATLSEHQRGFWAAQGPVASPELLSHTELEQAFYVAKLTDEIPGETLVDLRARYFAGVGGLPAGNAVNDNMGGEFAGGAPPPDATPPTPGTLASSGITDTAFTLTVSGASDAVALHASPYAFSTDNGASWSAYQSSPIFPVTGKVASTGYTCIHRTRDAAGNVATGSSILVTTTAPAPFGLYVDKGVEPADLTTYTFAGKTIGAPDTFRRVAVMISTNSTRVINSVTIGGVAATLHYSQAVGGTARMAVASAIVPTGTTADIVVVLDGVGLGMGIGVWRLGGAGGSVYGGALYSSGDNVVAPLVTVAGDFVIEYAFWTGVSGASAAFGVGTERFDESVYSATTWHAGADTTAVGSNTNVQANVTPDVATVMTLGVAFYAM